jgi:glycosyltransferase involved in cell wall biosynthesis
MNEKLRIALIASNRFPISQPFAGGMEAHVWHLARALAGRGHQVSLFAAAGSDAELDCQTIAVRPLAISRVALADVSMPPDAFMADHHAYLTLMLQLAGCARGDFDIIHNHSLHYLPVAMAAMLSTPMLTTVHTPPTPWLESAVDAAQGVGTHFAAVSEHTATAWRNAIERITVVPNGVAAERWPLGRGGGSLVWFGRIVAEKAPHLAIAAARLARMPLTLAGPISDPDYYASQVAPQLDNDIRYVGHLDQDRLARLVGQASAALVTPTWDEPYGLVVAEAMCCGTPVVAFERGGIPEVVAPQSGQLVPAGDVAAVAAAIPTVVKLSRRRVREHAIDRCSSQAMVNAYLDLYQRMRDSHSEASNDRLLHSPSRFWASGASDQHRRTVAPPGHCAELSRASRATSVHGGREVTV